MNRKGHTLIEILMVTLILSLIAALVVRKYTVSLDQSKDGTRDTNITLLKRQIELYRLEHNDQYPDADLIVQQLTGKTDSDGFLDPDGNRGPYVERFPRNPWINGDGSGDLTTDYGWNYDDAVGEITGAEP